MTEKRTWHQPKLQTLDAAATAGDNPFVSDDSTQDNFTPNLPDQGNLHDHTDPTQADFS